MENTQIAKKEETQMSFIERLVNNADSLNKIKEVGMVIIESGFCPDHFKQSKDAVGVVMCIEAGRQLGMSWMQALSDLYPVKGRIGMMGDAAVALIQGSGVLEYWKEETRGTYPNNDYTHIIISKRKGYPNEHKSEFSMYDAQTAGLAQKDIYRKFGKRMIRYRNVGFHARDFYAEIMKGMKTVEELNDYDFVGMGGNEGKTTLLTKEGKELKVDQSKTAQSETISNNVSNSIDKAKGGIPEAEVVVESAPLAEETPEGPKVYTLEELDAMKGDVLKVAYEILPKAKFTILDKGACGKRTARLFVSAILAHQEGKLDEFIDAKIKARQSETAPAGVSDVPPNPIPPVKENEPVKDDMAFMDKPPVNAASTNANIRAFEEEKNVSQAPQADLFGGKPEAKTEGSGGSVPNISELNPDGRRDFMDVYKLIGYFGELGINDGNVRAQTSFVKDDSGNPVVYDTLESFLNFAKKDDVLALIQKLM
jgi:hypothetical protein